MHFRFKLSWKVVKIDFDGNYLIATYPTIFLENKAPLPPWHVKQLA